MQRLIDACLERPTATILIAALVTLACGSGAFRLGITSDYRVFFSEDNPQLLDFQEQEALFYQSDTLIFGVAGEIFSPRMLAAIDWLTERSKHLPHVTRVHSVTNYPHFTTQGDALSTGPLVRDVRALTPGAASAVAAIVRDREDINGRLVSPDGQTALVVASVQLPGPDERRQIPEVVLPARTLAAAFETRWPDVEIHLFGIVPFNQTLAETTLRDLWYLFPFSIALMALGLWWFLGGMAPAAITGVVVLTSTAVAMGLAGWSGVVLTTATAVAPVIILTLGVADSVHLISTFQEGRAAGLGPVAAMHRSLNVNFQPVFLTSFTTVIGFLTFNFSEAPPFRELGNLVAIGVAVAWLASILLLPPLILKLGGGQRRHGGTHRWSAFGRRIARHHRRFLWGSLIVVAPLAYLVPLNSINDVFREWFSLRDPVRVGIEFGIERMRGVEQLHYTLDAGQSDGVVEPEFTHQVQAFSDWLRTQPEVVHVSDYLHVLKRMNRVLQDDAPSQYRLPESAELGRQFLSAYELAQPPGHNLNDVLDLDRRRARLSIIMRPATSSQLRAFDERARDWLARNAPRIVTGQANGALMMFAELGQRNARSMLWGTLLSLAAISAIMMLTLRSVRLGAISLVPNLLPAAVGFGIWALISAEINIAIALVVGMTYGIVVDDTIHFLTKYRRARWDGLSPAAAVEDTFAGTGRALWVMTVVLVAGFLVLALSDFRPTADMGLLTAIVLAAALAFDLVQLPALLVAIDSEGSPRSEA